MEYCFTPEATRYSAMVRSIAGGVNKVLSGNMKISVVFHHPGIFNIWNTDSVETCQIHHQIQRHS